MKNFLIEYLFLFLMQGSTNLGFIDRKKKHYLINLIVGFKKSGYEKKEIIS